MSALALSRKFADRVREAAACPTRLRIRGGGSKDFYARRCEGEPLDLSGLRGVVHYEPAELVITALAGTPLDEIEELLRNHGQQLPFEPPHFGSGATIGGAVATGLSGPRRAYAGALRDAVLGVRVINGRGEILRFGGEVMKNVAGYDVSRLMAGSLGTLGVLLEVSLKVQPRPPLERTVVFGLDLGKAIERMLEIGLRPLAVTATCYDGETLYVRLCGGERSLEAAENALGGETLSESATLWRSVREQTHTFFRDEGALWRLSLPAATPPLDLPGESFLEWGGALRWLRTDAPAQAIWQRAAQLGGHATLFRGHDGRREVFQPLAGPLLRAHQALKRALDPQGIFNRGRMYADL
jgi:glycolate oxidase FAD binding subunit